MESRIFKQIVQNVNDDFLLVKKEPGYQPARNMIRKIWKDFYDRDGKFLERFQTDGFNSRLFELYLFKTLKSLSFNIDNTYASPDYYAKKDEIEFFLEATTVNCSINPDFSTKNIEEMEPEELRVFLEDEIPIRFGSALYSKLSKRYWERKHCINKPLVIAVEGFYNGNAHNHTVSAIIRYLYGIKEIFHYEDGKLIIEDIPIENHKIGDKDIPSKFFDYLDAQYISAVIITNSATISKFTRMGYQEGLYNKYLQISRIGSSYDWNPNSSKAINFSYDLDNARFTEKWENGMVVCYNPNAIHQLPKGIFGNVVQFYIEDDKLTSGILEEFPVFNSKTFNFYIPQLKINRNIIRPLTFTQFIRILGNSLDINNNPLYKNIKYFSSIDFEYISCLVYDKIDDDYNYVIYKKSGIAYNYFSMGEFNKSLYEVFENMIVYFGSLNNR